MSARLTAQPPVYAKTPPSSKPLLPVRVAAFAPNAAGASAAAESAAAGAGAAPAVENSPFEDEPMPMEEGMPAFVPAAGLEGEAPQWPDDAAESAFRAEARDRGETVKAARSTVDAVEEAAEAKALPKLEEMVEKIPAEVRDVLEDLFRAKFVRVQKIPKRLLKS